MKKKIRQKMAGERGAVPIVEAALVYPIVIFVVFIFFFFGNMFYQYAKVDAIAVRAAEKLAAYYTNSMLYDGIPTNAEDLELDPYRYLFGSDGAEEAVRKYIDAELKETGSGGFAGMEITPTNIVCEIENYVVYHTAKVQIEYSVNYSLLQLLGIDSVQRSSAATANAAGDPAEFIRNIDMILDYADITGLTDAIRNTLSKFTGK